MMAAGVQAVVLELRFGPDFPFSPPFVRVIRPRFLPFRWGGGGHVTLGGAMCMEPLTAGGWLPATSLENVLLQVKLALCSTDPQPARLLQEARPEWKGNKLDYGLVEAMEAYQRAINTHGWKAPSNWRQAANGV
jgi:ubiquitin-conjugating enzyme E2 Q